MTLQEILAQLEHNDGHFPGEAILAAIDQRDEIVPVLLTILEDAAAEPESYAVDPDSMKLLYAMYLLAQFREVRAYPLLVTIFSLPGEMPFDLVGDAITEGLGKILASVSGGDTRGMASLIENEAVDPYVRSAALDGLLALVAAGLRTREEIVAYFQSLFQTLNRVPNDIWAWLACACTDLWPDETMHDLHLAWNEGLLDEEIISWDDIERDHLVGKDDCLRKLDKRHRLITDVAAELAHWASLYKDNPAEYEREDRGTLPSFFDGMPVRRSEPKVGRNQPCPCGSGKKFKKCCGGL